MFITGKVVSGYRVRNGQWTLIGRQSPQLPQVCRNWFNFETKKYQSTDSNLRNPHRILVNFSRTLKSQNYLYSLSKLCITSFFTTSNLMVSLNIRKHGGESCVSVFVSSSSLPRVCQASHFNNVSSSMWF